MRTLRPIVLLILGLLVVGCSSAAEQASTSTPTSTPPAVSSTVTKGIPTRTPTMEPTATATATFPPPTATSTTTDVPEEEDPFLDFSAIEGKWSGELEEAGGISSWIEIDLSSGAPRSDPVGTVRHGLIEGTPSCSGTWFAISAQGPSYRVREEITNGDTCHDGMVRLEMDTQTGTLLYDFTPIPANPFAEANGTLVRSE